MQTSRRTIQTAAGALVALVALSLAAGAFAARGGAPTCSDSPLEIATHGQHVVRDYVVGDHSFDLWPPRSGVGGAVAGRGAAVPGGPGPGYHFPEGVAPGASFCNPQSRSPGFHFP